MISTTQPPALGLNPDATAPTVERALPADYFSAAIEPLTLALRLSLAVVILLGFSVRVIGLNAVGFNTDEAVYAGQAAGILNDAVLQPFFPVFRAHPLLFQFILALTYAFTGVNDYVSRLLAAGIGTLTLLAVFSLGRSLYGARAGVIAALFMALMPYHVIVTRQVLLDGPMTLFGTLGLCAMAFFARTAKSRWLYVAGVCTGLAFLSKETAIITVAASYLFLVLSPSVRVKLRDVAISLVIAGAMIAIFPLTITLSGASQTGQSYLLWQLLRRTNHPWTFYLDTVMPFIGWLLALAAVAGLIARRRAGTWRETLLVSWIVVPVVFFQVWPVKGFQYLMPITPALSVLAAALFAKLPDGLAHIWRWQVPAAWLRAIGVSIIALSLSLPTFDALRSTPGMDARAGMGGLPGGREVGLWFKENTPAGSEAIAIGPNIANLVQFYGQRKTHMLSISQNPQQRNPSYEPIANPDLRLRNGDVHYIIWDAYSASRSPFFAKKLMALVRRFHGHAVHTFAIDSSTLIVVYEVRP
jgi:4-amino-4-deoxy-L-arabinose transferase-like glycosyltransferase